MIKRRSSSLPQAAPKGVRFVDLQLIWAPADRRSCSIDETAIDAIVERLDADSERGVFERR